LLILRRFIPNSMLNPAGALTLLRLPLAILFPFVAWHWGIALVFLYAAAISDIVDGVVARRMGNTSEIGGFVDGWLDKMFNVTAGFALVAHGWMPPWAALLLFTRELIQIVQVPYFIALYRSGSFPPNCSDGYGKATTVSLVVAMTAALVGVQSIMFLACITTGVLGLLSGLTYAFRDLEAYKSLQ
jgi:cardiolipin synthase (CMP-forming)